MSNILKFREPLVNGVPRSEYLEDTRIKNIFFQTEIDDKKSPLSIFLRKKKALRKKMIAACEECRNAYLEKQLIPGKETRFDFFVELPDSDDPNINNLSYILRIDATSEI